MLFQEDMGPKTSAWYWLSTMVIRPIITYATIVWWLNVAHKTSGAKLSKLQRLALLGTTGATLRLYSCSWAHSSSAADAACSPRRNLWAQLQ
jgi:hypothetical protein